MRSIFVLLILVMIGLNGKGQSVTALPDSVLSQCCLEVTLLNGNVTTVDWVFIQYITRDGTGTKLFVEYAPNFGGIQWETQIRIQNDFDDVLEQSKFIIIPFTVGSTDYGINRNWIANIEENTTTGGTWIYGRFGTPTKRKFSAVEDYETMKNLLLACRPRAIVVAENGLYTEGDTVRMGGFLIENTSITTEGYNWQLKDTLSSAEFGLDYLTPETGDTTVYWARRSGSVRQMVQMGNRYWYNVMKDTVGGLYSDFIHTWNAGDPFLKYLIFNPLAPNSGTAWMQIQRDNSFLLVSNETTNPYYTAGWTVTSNSAQIGVNESGSGDPGNGVVMGAFGDGTSNEYLFMVTKAVDNNTATNGQYLQLVDNTNGKVEFATIDLSAYLPIADTAAMLDPYIQGAGTLNYLPKFTAGRVLGNSNIFDDGNKVEFKNGKPIQLPEWTTVGRPTVANNRWGFNTTNNWLEGYSVSGWVAPAQAANADGKFLVGTIPYADANGRLKFGSYSEIYVSAVDFVAYRAPIFSSNQSGIPGGLRIYNTNTTSSLGYGSVALYPSTGGHYAQFFCTNTLYPGYGVITPSSFGHYTNGSGGMAIQLDNASSSLRIGIGTTGTIEKMRMDANGLGLFTTATQELDVNGDVRVRDSLRLPILSSILQTEASGWVKALTIGTGLSYSAGTLSSTGTWLKTELEAGRDVDITGVASTDLRIRNTRIQFDNKFKVGSDSTFVHDATADTLYNYGNVRFNLSGISNAMRLNSTGLGIGRTATASKLEVQGDGEFHGATGVTYIGAYGGSFPDPSVYNTGYIYNTNTRFGIFSGPGFSVGDEILLHATSTRKVSIRALNDTIPGIGISLSKATFIRERLIIAPDSTFKFDPTTDLLQLSKYGTPSTTAAALSKTLTNYGVGFATDGTVTSREIKRDTTIYVVDADYDFSAALTTAQVAARHNRVIFLMTTTAAAGSDSELTLHTPDVNLMQCEYLVRSTDEAGGFDNRIIFGTNNAVDSTNGLVTNYYPSAGSGVGIRAGLRSGVYKYFYY